MKQRGPVSHYVKGRKAMKRSYRYHTGMINLIFWQMYSFPPLAIHRQLCGIGLQRRTCGTRKRRKKIK